MTENAKFQGVSDVTNVPLKFYHVTGCHPRTKTNFWYFYRFFCVSAIFLLFSFGIIQIDLSLKAGLNESVEPLQSTILMFQAWTRGLVLWYQKDNLEKLFVGSAKFWRKSITREHLRFLRMTKFFNNFYLFWCFWVAFLYSIGPILGGAKTVFTVYAPPGINLKLYNALHLFMGCVSFSYLMGGDVIFSSICSEAIIQFGMLSEKIQNLECSGRGQFERKLKKYMEYHSFLLEYCQTLNKFGAGIFLLQFVITIFASCVQLFIVLQKGFSLVNKMKCFVFFTGQLAEFGIYCVLAEILIETSSKIGNSVYHLNWYREKYQQGNRDFPKAVLMIVRRSQKELKFSGYGLVTVNLTAFTEVFKSVLSFYAYMKTATEDKESLEVPQDF